METIESIATPVQRLKCLSCGELWEDGENTSPLYECGECDERFTRNNATYGNHQCSCGRFASKVADEGCDDCDEECELVDAWECGNCEHVIEDEAGMLEHFSEEMQRVEEERAEEEKMMAPQPEETAYDHFVKTLNQLLKP